MSEATWTPTPGTETLGTVRTSVAGYVLMPTDPEVIEAANLGVRRAIDWLNVRNWNWALTYDDITFNSTTTDYPLTSWFKNPRHFEVWDTNQQSVSRLGYLEWKEFLMAYTALQSGITPTCYSCSNVNAFGNVSLNGIPSADWVAKYPSGRIWYFRKVQYPVQAADVIDVPSEVIGFVSAYAEGFVADRYAVAKAVPAYARAQAIRKELISDDCHGRQTDWE